MVALSAEGADRNAHARVRRDDKPACRFDHELGYRVLPNHHREGICDGGMGDCTGCQPCPEAHCVVCLAQHVSRQTCAGCIGRVRADLQAIVLLHADLPNAARARPSGDIPGGIAQVLFAPYSPGQAALHLALAEGDWHELDDDGIGPQTPQHVLDSWEDDWRKTFGHPAAVGANTISASTDYLDKHLARAAAEHEAFAEFAAAVRRTRGFLHAVLGNADPTVYGVACFDCGHTLRQDFHPARRCRQHKGECACDQGGRRDSWVCGRCGRTYTDHDYRRAVRQAHTDVQPWRSPSEVAAITGCTERTLRRWAAQGYVGRKQNGNRTLYHVGDVRRHAMLHVYEPAGPTPSPSVTVSPNGG